MHDRGLSTKIGKGRDSYGNRLRSDTRYKYRRLRRWNRRLNKSGTRERNLAKALSHIDRVGDNLNLPDNVMKTAAQTYRQALDKDVIKGRTIESIALASLHIACRVCKVVRVLNVIAEESSLSTKQLARAYRHLYWNVKNQIPSADHTKYLSKIASKVDLYGESLRLAQTIMKKATEEKLTVGRSPYSIASAYIYITSKIAGEHITQREITEAANTTQVTIRNRYKELLRKLDITVKL